MSSLHYILYMLILMSDLGGEKMRTAELHQTRLPALLTEVLKKVAKDPVYLMRTGHAYFGPTYICPRVYVIGFSECWPYIFRLKHVHPRVLDCVPCLSRHVLLSDCVAWSNEFFKHWMQNALFSKVDFKPATLIFPAPYAETFMELMILHDKRKEPTRLLALMHRHAWLLPKNWVIQL